MLLPMEGGTMINRKKLRRRMAYKLLKHGAQEVMYEQPSVIPGDPEKIILNGKSAATAIARHFRETLENLETCIEQGNPKRALELIDKVREDMAG